MYLQNYNGMLQLFSTCCLRDLKSIEIPSVRKEAMLSVSVVLYAKKAHTDGTATNQKLIKSHQLLNLNSPVFQSLS